MNLEVIFHFHVAVFVGLDIVEVLDLAGEYSFVGNFIDLNHEAGGNVLIKDGTDSLVVGEALLVSLRVRERVLRGSDRLH